MSYYTIRRNLAKVIIVIIFLITVVCMICMICMKLFGFLREHETVTIDDDLIHVTLKPARLHPIGKRCNGVNLSIARTDYCDGCFQHEYKYIMQNIQICKIYNFESPITVFVFILITHKDKFLRNVIRTTWLSETKNNTGSVRYAFLLGKVENNNLTQEVEQENIIYNDIIQEDFLDTYRNLTLKTVMGLKWAVNNCEHAQFVLKIDADMWMNINSLIKFIQEKGHYLQTNVGGLCVPESTPDRSPDSKFVVSCKEYPYEQFPSYCSGTGYVTSMSVAKQLFEISRNVPFLAIEDVYIGLCLEQLKLDTITFPEFLGRGAVFGLCKFKEESVVTVHHVTPEKMLKICNSSCG